MARTRSAATPKKKPTATGKVVKHSEAPKSKPTPKKKTLPTAKVVKTEEPTPIRKVPAIINGNKKNTTRKTNSVRCRKWIESQLAEKPCLQYNQICENSDGDGEEEQSRSLTSLEHDEPKTAISTERTIIAKPNVSLVCEWKRCSQLFPSYASLRDHVREHHLDGHVPSRDDGLFQCCWDLCSDEAASESDFRRHTFHHIFHSHLKSIGESLLLRKTLPPCLLDSRQRNNNAEVHGDWTCKWLDCKETSFDQIYDFIAHMQLHLHFEGSQLRRYESHEGRLYKCAWMGCDKVYDRKCRIVEHVRMHTHERMMGCPNCGATFTTHTKFYAHFNRQGEDKKYQCVHCCKFFFTEELLSSHIYIHVNCYKCTLCDMTCPSPSGLANHVRYRHIAEKPFACQLCDSKFTNKPDLEKHILAKHEKHVYECEEFDCGFLTESLYLMKKHDRIEHCGIMENCYGCHCCPNRYTRGYLLSQHLIKVHSFQLPSGHSRFIYSPDLEGIFRLQTMRMESLEVTQAVMSPSRSEVLQKSAATNKSLFTYTLSAIEQTDNQSEALNINICQTPVAQTQFATPQSKEIPRHSNQGAFSMPTLQCSDDDESNSTDAANRNGKVLRTTKRRAAAATTAPSIPMMPLKSIQDFSVMKRYLHNERLSHKEITIEVKTVNASGDVIEMDTVKTGEICVASFEWKS